MDYRTEILKILNKKNLKQKEFAKKVRIAENHFNKIICGDAALTIKMAVRLELAGFKTAKFWAILIAEEQLQLQLQKY